MISRRSFLQGAAVSAAALALLGPEILLPKARRYFLPPTGGWPNQFENVRVEGWQGWRWAESTQQHHADLFDAIAETYKLHGDSIVLFPEAFQVDAGRRKIEIRTLSQIGKIQSVVYRQA